MNWFEYFLQIAVLVSFVWILKLIFFRPKSNKTEHLEVNNDFTDKNKVDEKIQNESSSENSCLNFEELKNSEPSKSIDNINSYENEEFYETCNNENTNMINVLECSGYGTNEEEIQNCKLNTSDKSQHNLDIHNSSLKIIPQESMQRKNTNSIVHNAYNVSIGTEVNLQNSNLESTEDEGNESQMESSQEDLKKKTYNRKYKNVKRFTPIEIDDFENNENTQSSAEMYTKGFHQKNDFSFGSSTGISEEENYSEFKNFKSRTISEILYKDTQLTYSDENQQFSDSNNHYLLECSRSLSSSIYSDDSSFQNIQDTQFTDSNESQETSDTNSSYLNSLPSSIHRDDSSFQYMQESFKEDYDVSFINSTASSNDEMNLAFIETI